MQIEQDKRKNQFTKTNPIFLWFNYIWFMFRIFNVCRFTDGGFTMTNTTKGMRVLGRVESVNFGYEDHGILTLYVELAKEDGFHQSFGGYCLDGYDEKLKRRKGTAGGLDFIIQVMRVFKATKLEDIVGKMCYALYDQEGLGRTIQGLQALEIDGGQSFLIDTWQKQWFPKESIDA